MKCQCENSKCPHGYQQCPNKPVWDVHTIYGKMIRCDPCKERMPDKYIRYLEKRITK